jgi:hypothetical protein
VNAALAKAVKLVRDLKRDGNVRDAVMQATQYVEADVLAQIPTALAHVYDGAALPDDAPVAPPAAKAATPATQTADDMATRYEQYSEYLKAIFKPQDVVCFVLIEHNKDGDDKKERVAQQFTTLEDALTKETFLHLVRANNEPSTVDGNSESSVYVAMNAYRPELNGKSVGRTQENVVNVRALQSDMDDASRAASVVSAMQNDGKIPAPTIVVESSTGKRQAIWTVDHFPKDAAKPVMQAIAKEYGTDSAVAEVARVMRVAGFINRKHAYTDKPVAKLLSNTGKRYTRTDFQVEAAPKFEQHVSPDEYLNAPFIRKGGAYGGIYPHVLKIVGHYVPKIKDGDVMFDLVNGCKLRNGCFLSDGVTPYKWNEEQVRQQCHKLVQEWKDKGGPIALTQNILTGVAEPPTQAEANQAADASKDADGTFPFGDAIPEFHDEWITGSFRKMVDAICGGTTIPTQYVWHASKAMVCSILTKCQTKLEDCESARTYFVVFGETGTGKGLSFRRTQKLVDAVRGQNPFVKIITSIDSQAGIRDAFFDMPSDNNLPILFFANEVKNIGHKSDSKKNPDILDALVELADETTVTVTKAKKSLKAKACKSRENSWLLTYVCSQDKEAFATAFPRTKDQGLPDRFIPEYSPRIEAGSLPEPNFALGAEGLEEIIKTVQSSKTTGLTMSVEAKATFQDVWGRQETQYKTSPRFRQQLMLEVYLKAIGEGRTVALPSDVLVANEVVERRKPIRQKYLDEQIPNQAGVYTSRLKAIHAKMLKQLRRGIRWETAAVSKRDLATMTLAYKEADLMTFNQAWNSMKSFWTPVNLMADNGQTYAKFVPMPEEHDMWLPPTGAPLGAER